MLRSFTQQNAWQNKCSAFFGKALILLLLLSSLSVTLFAHTVDQFTSCGYVCAGSNVAINAKVSNTNSNTNYNWQFRDNSNAWKCFINGSNTINGVAFTVSGATAKGQRTTAPTLNITNARTALHGVDLRLVMADGNNVSPCASNPSYPVYGTDKTLELHVLTGNDCSKIDTYCSGGSLKLGNLLWNDVNGNGLKEADEAGVGGITIRLYRDTNGDNIADNNAVIATSETNSNGNYLFTGLNPGKYIAGLIIPAGYTVSGGRVGNPDNNVDNDNNAINVVNNESEVRSNAITLSAGGEPVNDGDDNNSNLTLDLAICGRADIGDFVWNDLDMDGIQDSNEPGIPNVKVTLTYPDGTTTSKTTNSDGKYIFVNLGPGTHKVTFATPSGFTPSPANQGSNDEKDSDPVNGSVSVTVIAVKDNLTIDAGFYKKTPPTGILCLGNQVWNDRDGDGKRDLNEPGIPGATISLYTDNNGDNLPDGAAFKTTQSDANGRYLFTDLAEGRYIASMPILPGYQKSPNTSTQATSPFPDNNIDNDNNLVRLVGPNAPGGIVYTNFITLNNGQEPVNDGDGANGNLTFDLAECGNSYLGDFVWNDLDGDGIQDAGEPGINGVLVTLTFPDGTTATEETHTYNAPNNQNAPQFDGYYDFENLGPGMYKVTFAKPAGFNPSPANQDGNDAKDSDPVNEGPVTVTLAANQSNFTIDAGFTKFTPPAKILCLGNQVWNDRDGDGKRDLNEPGIPGATISLYTDNNSDDMPDGAAIRTTVTDSAGRYQFSDLAEGRYIASMPILPGYQKSPNTSTQLTSPFPDNDVDNDNNLVRLVGPNAPGGIVYTNAITLSIGGEPTTDGDGANCNQTFDLAECGNSYIGDFVWNDLDGDGVQDAGEPGINGVLVTITFPDGRTATETTHTYNASNNLNAPQFDGYYDFKNLGPGTYKVTFAKPAGFNPSPANQGGNDAKDSDPVNEGAVTVTLAANQSDFTIDAGFTKYTPPIANLRLGNQVWNDRDGDGKRDLNEPAIPGVLISLYTDNNSDDLPDGPAIRTTTSNDQGRYLFSDLLPGRYIASMPILPGYQKSPNSSTQNISPFPDLNVDDVNKLVRLVGPNGPGGVVYTNAITLAAGTEPTTDGDDANGNLTFDLAECGNSFIGDFVWNDLNGNGIQDAGEPGINGVLVTITFPDGRTATEATHTYNAPNNQNAPQFDGYYDFENLGPGTYLISFATPAGLNPSPANQGGNDAKDSDPVNGAPVSVTIAANESDFTIDAGFTAYTPPVKCPNLSLGNFVFLDLNGNCKKDYYEFGVSDVKVNLYIDADGNNTPDGAAIATVTTAEDGTYLFSNLAEGKYIVGVELKNGYAVAGSGVGTPDNNVDNDNNGVRTVNGEVRSNAITLVPGTEPVNDGSDNNNNNTLDFGFKKDFSHYFGRDGSISATEGIDTPEATMGVYPNPAGSNFTLNVNSAKQGTAAVRIMDATGKVYITANKAVTNGSNAITFSNSGQLKSGTYNVQLILNGQVLNQKLIVSK